jgi:hypothetical protein
MHASFLKFSKLALINVKIHPEQSKRSSAAALGLCLAGLLLGQPSLAHAQDTLKLTIKNHVFSPATLEVPANKRFQIEVENLDTTPAEFESSELRVEKFVVGGGKIIVRISPLKPGTYKFFEDYHPDTGKGTITAK